MNWERYRKTNEPIRLSGNSPATSPQVKEGQVFQLGVVRSASGVKDVLLKWCQARTREYQVGSIIYLLISASSSFSSSFLCLLNLIVYLCFIDILTLKLFSATTLGSLWYQCNRGWHHWECSTKVEKKKNRAQLWISALKRISSFCFSSVTLHFILFSFHHQMWHIGIDNGLDIYHYLERQNRKLQYQLEQWIGILRSDTSLLSRRFRLPTVRRQQ